MGTGESTGSKAPIDVLVLPGDGIGPEISEATVRVLRETARIFDLPLRFDTMAIGFA